MRTALSLSALVVFFVATSMPGVAQDAKPERKFDKGTALRVVRKGTAEPFFLQNPVTVRIGDRHFLTGDKIDGKSSVYIPVSEIELIEAFPSVDALKKEWKIGRRAVPPSAVANNAPPVKTATHS